jgi:hypothetical protein
MAKSTAPTDGSRCRGMPRAGVELGVRGILPPLPTFAPGERLVVLNAPLAEAAALC